MKQIILAILAVTLLQGCTKSFMINGKAVKVPQFPEKVLVDNVCYYHRDGDLQSELPIKRDGNTDCAFG